jgi:psiF repeat
MRLIAAYALSLSLLAGAALGATTPPPDAKDTAAAAKHAKLAACRKQARAKKLVGDDAKDFVKACVAK